MAAVHISPWGLAFQTKLSGRCRQTTTINEYPGTDGSSRSQYSAVCITTMSRAGLCGVELYQSGGRELRARSLDIVQSESRKAMSLSSALNRWNLFSGGESFPSARSFIAKFEWR
jgi:hypothetical protein